MGTLGRLEINVEFDINNFRAELDAAVGHYQATKDKIAALASADEAADRLVSSVKVTSRDSAEESTQ